MVKNNGSGGSGGSSAPAAFGAHCGSLPNKSAAYDIAVNVSTFTFLKRLESYVNVLEVLTYGTIMSSLIGQALVIYNNLIDTYTYYMWLLFAICGLLLAGLLLFMNHARNLQKQVMREADLDVDYFPYCQ